jgi:hypothetical protein
LHQNYPFPFFKEKLKLNKKRILKTARYPEPLFTESIHKCAIEYSSLPNEIQFAKDLAKLKIYLDTLISKGCTVILFETPIEQALNNTLKMRYERSAIRSVLINKKLFWITPDTLNRYTTNDGIHLLEESVYTYLNYLNSQSSSPINRTQPGVKN